jgi:hypothetical protein
MTAITKDQPLRVFGKPVMKKWILDSSIAQTWYRGEALIIDQTADAVNATPVHAIANPAVANNDVFVGIAMEGGSFPISTLEGLSTTGVEAYMQPTVLGFLNNTTLTNASIGLGIYLSEGNQLVLVASVDDIPYIGILQFVEDGYAYVKLVTQICTGA